MPKLQSYFTDSLSTAEHSGGVSGSVRVTVLEYGKEVYYQFKYSVLNLRAGIDMRRVKANGYDHENLRDVYLANTFKPMLGSLCPEVLNVYDADKKKFHAASKYLDNVHKGTLDHYYSSLDPKFAQEFNELNDPKHPRKKLSNGAKHCKVVLGQGKSLSGDFTLHVDEKSQFAKSLADALAMSAIGLDHDVNPGNMVVIKDKVSQELKVARIDFGHALGDLLNTKRLFGGKLRDKENPVFDFFNRSKVAGAKYKGDPAKFWRDYAGFSPSKILAESLINLGSDTAKLKEGLEFARREILDLLSMINDNPLDNYSEYHLINSIRTIYTNVTGKKVDIISGFQQQALIQMLDGIEASVLHNAENAVKAGQMMLLQVELNADMPNLKEVGFENFRAKWIGKFKDAKFADMYGNMYYPWFKETKDLDSYQGGVSEYILNKYILQASHEVNNNPSKESLSKIKKILGEIKNYLYSMIKKAPQDINKNQLEAVNILEDNIELGIMHCAAKESGLKGNQHIGGFETSVSNIWLFTPQDKKPESESPDIKYKFQ